MKTTALTIRLDKDLEKQLIRLAKRTGQSRSELVREALRRQFALVEQDHIRKRSIPFAEARGYLTDEDIFRDASRESFLDSNVLVSAVATRGICYDVLQTVITKHELLLGETVNGETRRSPSVQHRLANHRAGRCRISDA